METGYGDAQATVIALADGNANIYVSSSGGCIGGISHEAVRSTAKTIVRLAAEYLPQQKPVSSFPLPTKGQTVFYLLTDNGVSSGGAMEAELGEPRHALSRLFSAGQEVITQYRLTEQKK
jgi:hypothetical protein